MDKKSPFDSAHKYVGGYGPDSYPSDNLIEGREGVGAHSQSYGPSPSMDLHRDAVQRHMHSTQVTMGPVTTNFDNILPPREGPVCAPPPLVASGGAPYVNLYVGGDDVEAKPTFPNSFIFADENEKERCLFYRNQLEKTNNVVFNTAPTLNSQFAPGQGERLPMPTGHVTQNYAPFYPTQSHSAQPAMHPADQGTSNEALPRPQLPMYVAPAVSITTSFDTSAMNMSIDPSTGAPWFQAISGPGAAESSGHLPISARTRGKASIPHGHPARDAKTMPLRQFLA